MPEFIQSSAYFAVALTLIAFSIASACQKKWKSALLNPILISAALIIAVLKLAGISNEVYQSGCRFLNFLLTPATICLAVSFYEQFQHLKPHLPAVCAGVLAGTAASLASVWGLSRLFDLERVLTLSLLPKSVTTAIALGISENGGGIPGITAGAVVITGIEGAVLAPFLSKLFHITDPVAEGVAIGACSHAVGTSKALEIGKIQGAMSSISLCVCGIITTALALFFM